MNQKNKKDLWLDAKNLTLEMKLGQMFVTGFPAGQMNTSFCRLVEEYKVGNVILFKENLLKEKQMFQLCRDIHALIEKNTGVPPFITSDEEGGIVSRLPDSMGKMPSAMALSSLKDPHKVYKAALKSGEQLKAMGINFNLAPVLDINSNIGNPVIGVRSYGRGAEDTWNYAAEALRGYMDAGVMCSGKHFPGHGDTISDSHLELPRSVKSMEELQNLELFPFEKAIEQKIPAVTIAHVVYEALDEVPATISHKIVTDLLRGQLGFDGLVISDCMEMNAISSTYGVEEGVIQAVLAGVELIFISHDHERVRSAMDALRTAVETGRVPMSVIDAAVGHILHYKKRYAAIPDQLDEEILHDCHELSRQLFRETIDAGTIFHLGKNPCFISPKQTQVSQVSNMEQSLCFAEEMQKKYGGVCVQISLRPEEDEIRKVLETAKHASAVVVGTLNATVYKGQLAILKELEKQGTPLACVTLRNPFELELLSKETFGLAAWEYSRRSIARAAEFFDTECKEDGKAGKAAEEVSGC